MRLRFYNASCNNYRISAVKTRNTCFSWSMKMCDLVISKELGRRQTTFFKGAIQFQKHPLLFLRNHTSKHELCWNTFFVFLEMTPMAKNQHYSGKGKYFEHIFWDLGPHLPLLKSLVEESRLYARCSEQKPGRSSPTLICAVTIFVAKRNWSCFLEDITWIVWIDFFRCDLRRVIAFDLWFHFIIGKLRFFGRLVRLFLVKTYKIKDRFWTLTYKNSIHCYHKWTHRLTFLQNADSEKHFYFHFFIFARDVFSEKKNVRRNNSESATIFLKCSKAQKCTVQMFLIFLTVIRTLL